MRTPWIIRTYAGFGDAETSNRRFRENLKKGQRGLSIAFDLPTQNGFDAIDPLARAEVGVTGVPVSHLGDMDLLLKSIDLSHINTSMTINATAPWLYSLYLALAEKRKIPWRVLRGTTQNDLLKELVARGTYIFNPMQSLKLSCDLIEFSAQNTPEWNPINCCGYHYMESGSSPAQEIGFSFGNALLILDEVKKRIPEAAFENVVRRISFFINSGIELVPEIGKVRAYGQLWGELCAQVYGVSNVKFRAGCQVRSLTLTEQQVENNIVRIAYEALPVTLSKNYRVGALQLPGFREAQGLPDEAEQTLSLRTQQILMHETELDLYEDIFEGSHVVEKITETIKAEAKQIAFNLREQGFERAMGSVSQSLTGGLLQWRKKWESKEKILVGVNEFLDPIGLVPASTSAKIQDKKAVDRHLKRLKIWFKQRRQSRVDEALDNLRRVAEQGENILPASIALARAQGTTGEWTRALETVFGGRFQSPLGYDIRETFSFNLPKAKKPARVLMAKCGLDGHINAIKMLSYACSKAGLEVIFTGIKQTPEQIVRAALQEDARVIGISSLAGAHVQIARDILKGLKKHQLKIPVVMGGIMTPKDKVALKNLGVKAVFTPADNKKLSEIVATILKLAKA